MDALPARLARELRDVRQPDPAEVRPLHGKLLLLADNADRRCALVGSANFSAPGLGLSGPGNVELGVAVAARDHRNAAALDALVLAGEPIPLGADLEAEEDLEERTPALPLGFCQALFDPGEKLLWIELDPSHISEAWWIVLPSGQPLVQAGDLPATDSPTWTEHRLDEPVFNVEVRWIDPGGIRQKVALAVNVTDPAALPAPEQLRTLPVARFSVRLPLPGRFTRPWWKRWSASGAAAGTDDHLDPLKRFSSTGQLLHRTRDVSAALAGLRDRLERPAVTFDALRCRLHGPFGPLALTEKLMEQQASGRALPGETTFLLGEIALTLAMTDLDRATRYCPGAPRGRRTDLARGGGQAGRAVLG